MMLHDERQSLHREAESIKETVKHAEALILVCVDSIRLNAVPECQNVADVLESLFESLFKAGRDAKVLENTLYRGYVENGNKCVVIASDEDWDGVR